MSSHNSRSQGDEKLVRMLLDTAVIVERRLDRELSHTRGISFSEYRLLSTLSTLHNRTSMRVTLADAVGLTPSAITRALKPLEKLGYVSTQKSERDARRSLVTLTAAGIKLLADCQAVVADVIADLPLDSLNGARVREFRNRLLGVSATPSRRKSGRP